MDRQRVFSLLYKTLPLRWGAASLLGLGLGGACLQGALPLGSLEEAYRQPRDLLAQEQPERPASRVRPGATQVTSPPQGDGVPQELDIARCIALMQKSLLNYKAAQVHCQGGAKKLLLFGPTRSGKSTLISYLRRATFEAMYEEAEQESDDEGWAGREEQIIGFQVANLPQGPSGALPWAEISADVESCTVHPAGYAENFQGGRYLVVDTPGTEDHRGLTYPFSVAVSHRAFIGDEPVDAIGLVCKLSALTQSGGRTFTETFSLLYEIFEDPFAHIPSIFLFFSHPHDAPLAQYLVAYRKLIAMADRQEAQGIVSEVTKIAPLMKALYDHWRNSQGKGPKYGSPMEEIDEAAQGAEHAVPCNFFSINPLDEGAQRGPVFESLSRIAAPIPAEQFRFMGSARLRKQLLMLAEEKVLEAQRYKQVLANHPGEIAKIDRDLMLCTQKLKTLREEVGQTAVMTLKQAKKAKMSLRQQKKNKEAEIEILARHINAKKEESRMDAYSLNQRVHKRMRHKEVLHRGWFSFLQSYGEPAKRAHTFAYGAEPFLYVRERPGEEAGGRFIVRKYLPEVWGYVADYLPTQKAWGEATVEIVSYPRLVNQKAYEALQQELAKQVRAKATCSGELIVLAAELEEIEAVISGEREQDLDKLIQREEERQRKAQAQGEALQALFQEAQCFWAAEREFLGVLCQIIPSLGAIDRIALGSFGVQAYQEGIRLLEGDYSAGVDQEAKEED